jgi:hypothetical protein
MCYNFSTSIITYVYAIVCSIYLWFRNESSDRWFCIFGITFTTIQLIEAFIHLYIDNVKINKILSLLGFIVIFLEPLSNNIGGILYSEHKNLFIVSTILYSIFFIYIMMYKFPDDDHMITTKECNLIWHWDHKVKYLEYGIWLVFFTLPILFWSYPKNLVGFIIGLVSLLYPLFLKDRRNTGSLWCSLANASFICMVLLKQ